MEGGDGFPIPVQLCFPPRSEEQTQEEKWLYRRYDDIVATLPADDGWSPTLNLRLHDGFWHEERFLPGAMACQDHFQALPTDVFLTTYPRSGTTWFKSLILSTLHRHTHPPSSPNHPLLSHNPHELSPFLDYLYAARQLPDLTTLPPPRFLSTHLPYPALPDSMRRSRCKILHVCRDPKAAVVSLWRILLDVEGVDEQKLPLAKAVDLYCKGVTVNGPVWDNVGGYWKESLKDPERVLFVRYEEAEEDPPGVLRKVASFLGCPFSAEEEARGLPSQIAELCSFVSLSKLEVNAGGEVNLGVMKVEGRLYFTKVENRKWLGELTPEMVEKVEKTVLEKMSTAYHLKLSAAVS